MLLRSKYFWSNNCFNMNLLNAIIQLGNLICWIQSDLLKFKIHQWLILKLNFLAIIFNYISQVLTQAIPALAIANKLIVQNSKFGDQIPTWSFFCSPMFNRLAANLSAFQRASSNVVRIFSSQETKMRGKSSDDGHSKLIKS